ncbi:WXG100 family type VII secretion target [Kitasatospora sp. NPDC093558]|uniref:WXG100 family type VII secretion target n=1 Tax=Kitasatospora sp. NPDC093558 TaxID=3155201 RepID=UPI0034320970
MADLEFERRMNPWLFDDKGNLTEEAKKQFPDLTGSNNAPVALGAPSGAQTVKANPAAIQQAAQNAFALRDSVKTECDQPGEHVAAAATALSGWATSAALTGSWTTWSTQVDGLRNTISDIGDRLHATADNYANTEAAIHARMKQDRQA